MIIICVILITCSLNWGGGEGGGKGGLAFVKINQYLC